MKEITPECECGCEGVIAQHTTGDRMTDIKLHWLKSRCRCTRSYCGNKRRYLSDNVADYIADVEWLIARIEELEDEMIEHDLKKHRP